MKIYYPPPEAQHWIILRLMRAYTTTSPDKANIEIVRSFRWLRDEVGTSMLEQMVDDLITEEQNDRLASRRS